MAQQQLIIERILRDRDGVWAQIVSERGLKTLTLQMTVSCAISLAIYGAVLGASNGWAQALSSTIKLPLLFLATLAICMPTLYLFNLVFGARLSVMQALTLILTAITVTSALALAFAPISLFFLISAHNYSFFKLLNVAILVLSALVGLRFLTRGMAVLNEHQDRLAWARATMLEPAAEPAPEPVLVGAATMPADAPAPATAVAVPPLPHHSQPNGFTPPPPAPVPAASRSMTLLYIWILLFGFVGTQLGWTLRPFFGSPDEPFALFRDLSGTFYEDIIQTIGKLLGG